MMVTIDGFGRPTNECAAKYEIELDGSYEYSPLLCGWWYGIKSARPKLAMSRIFLKDMIFHNDKINQTW